MQRRAYLAGCTGALGALAGCTGFLGDSGSDSSGDSDDDRGPAETVEAFYDAALDGDGEAARSYIHPESVIPAPTDAEIERIESSNLQVESTEVVESGDGEATVEVTYNQPMMGGEPTLHFVLRRDEGEWKLYDQVLDGSSGPSAPQVQWDASERAEAGAVTAVSFVHSGGDNVNPSTLTATVDGSTVGASGSTSEVQAGTAVVVPLDGDGESVAAGATVTLVWSDPDGDSSQTLAEFTLTGDTAGSPAGQLRIEA